MPESETIKNEAMKFAMKLIGLRRRSELEIRQRLAAKKYSENLIDETVKELYKFKYLDDEDFAESYINDRLNFRPAGRFVIKMELKSRGISDKIIDSKLEEILNGDEKELEIAGELLGKKTRNMNPDEMRQNQTKLSNYLKSKGFSGKIIGQVIKDAIKSDEDPNLEIY